VNVSVLAYAPVAAIGWVKVTPTLSLLTGPA
jgi:hypothetical protein